MSLGPLARLPMYITWLLHGPKSVAGLPEVADVKDKRR
jgi:hypothetical protein